MTDTSDPRDSVRRQGKSAAAFRTISEVAEELDVPPHVLRFWESKFSQVKPLKRGGGRRYYRPEDVDLLRGIRELLYTDGYTIKGVQKLLREGGVRSVLNDQVTAPAEGAGTEAEAGRAPEVAAAPDAVAPPSEPAAVPDSKAATASGIGGEKRAALTAVLSELESVRELLRA